MLKLPLFFLEMCKGMGAKFEDLISRNLQRTRRVAVIRLLRTLRTNSKKRIQIHVRDGNEMEAALLGLFFCQFLKRLKVALCMVDIRRELIPDEYNLAQTVCLADLLDPVEDFLGSRHQEDVVVFKHLLNILKKTVCVLAVILFATRLDLRVFRDVCSEVRKFGLNLVSLGEEYLFIALDAGQKSLIAGKARYLVTQSTTLFPDRALNPDQKLLRRTDLICSRAIDD